MTKNERWDIYIPDTLIVGIEKELCEHFNRRYVPIYKSMSRIVDE